MTATPHDALFKSTFAQPEHAAAALRHALPRAVAARIDDASLKLESGSFIDEQLNSRQSDLLFSARLSDAPVFLYLLFEHQRTTDPLMPFRLLAYMVRIWNSHLAVHAKATHLPPILPVVLHHSDKGWTTTAAFHELLAVPPDVLADIAELVPQFRFVLDDVSAETDEALRSRAMTALGRLVLWCFRHGRDPEQLVARLSGWSDVVREARRAPGGMAALARVWRYILRIANPAQPEPLLQRLLTAAGPEAKEELVTLEDYLVEKGRLAGEREGRLAAGRTTLLKQLRLRFGELPEAVTARVAAADLEQLDIWTELVLTARTLGEALP